MDWMLPLKRQLNSANIIDRIEDLEEGQSAPPSDNVDALDETTTRTGEMVVDRLILPATGVEVTDPTSTDFTGGFADGDGIDFGDGDFIGMGGVNAGVLQWGGSNVDGKLKAGAGNVTLDENGITLVAGTLSRNSIIWQQGSTDIVTLQTYYSSNTSIFHMYNAGGVAGQRGSQTEIAAFDGGGSANINLIANDFSSDYTVDVAATGIVSFDVGPALENYVKLTVAESAFNEAANDVDFRAESTTDANMIFGEGSTGNVGIGTNAPTVKLEVNGNFLASNVLSGTYTPTLTNVTNVAASTAFLCQYMRVGSVVTVSGEVSIDPTAAGALELGMTLPIASNFTAVRQCGGTSAVAGVAGLVGTILADTTNDRASVQLIAVDTANRNHFFSFTYLIA